MCERHPAPRTAPHAKHRTPHLAPRTALRTPHQARAHPKRVPMSMHFSAQEIVETIRMVQMENLDIRTITLGISLRDCAHPDLKIASQRAYDKICRLAGRLLPVGQEIEREYGIPIINKRISVTPVALVAESS